MKKMYKSHWTCLVFQEPEVLISMPLGIGLELLKIFCNDVIKYLIV